MKYLDLDDASSDAMDALVAQAQTDMYATLSRCGDPADADGPTAECAARRPTAEGAVQMIPPPTETDRWPLDGGAPRFP